MDARFTVGRVSSSHRGDFIYVQITDDLSGIQIWSGELSLEDFARALTGLASVKAKTKYALSKDVIDNIGKIRKTKMVGILGVRDLSIKKEQFEELIIKKVSEQCQNLLKEGWFLEDIGIHRQQHHPNEWMVTLVKYEKNQNVES